ncbi:S9 family peptidase [Salisaeta longa]|uniref:S9 family peptidase n=1 Tax=Salisaeta longa TaxID=503170 RepID=UPI0003B5D684|nr:S9 family peptidase [Salisaeta longa]
MHRLFSCLVAVALCVVFVGPAQAQPSPADTTVQFTLEAIHASGAFSPERFQGGRWADSGPVITYIEPSDSSAATHLMRYNLETDERTRLINGENLYADDVDRLIKIQGYEYSNDGSKVLIYTDSKMVWRRATKGFYYVYNLEEQTLTPIAPRDEGYQMFAKFNPSATKVAFVRERDLHVVDLATGTETALTTDGGENGIINGTFDWVYEEEFGLRDGFRWSPDGQHIAFYKLDESVVPEYRMTNHTTRYPTYTTFKYPKAGEQNSDIKVGVIDMAEAGTPEAITYFDTQTWDPQLTKAEEATDPHEYLARMGWTPKIDGTHQVWMFRLNREQNRLDVLFGAPGATQPKVLLEERQETYIDVEDGKLQFLDDGKHFVYLSERTGYNHVHLYRNDGTYLGPITDGTWEVTEFHGIDEGTLTAYVTATRDTSIERQLYKVPVSLSRHEAAPAPTRITEQTGWHSINFSNDLSYYIDQYSSVTTPPSWTLHRASGEQLAVLQSNQALDRQLEALGVPVPTFTSVPAANGMPLNAYIIKPTDFNAAREYPLLMYVYGGPGAQTVTNRWGGSRMLWHQYLADTYNIVVASVDNRGTGGRGKAFQDIPYAQLGQPEAKDQIAAAEHFKAMDYIADDRVGIWGWSYGGYMTLLSMMYQKGPDTFSAGMSIAPVTDWRNYDTIYTERYMKTPQQNMDGYRNGAPVTYADELNVDQDLLLVHGSYDDNVHYQNSAQMVKALQAANKQFRFMVYPLRDHGIYGGNTRLHLFTMLTTFVEESLIEQEAMVGAAR